MPQASAMNKSILVLISHIRKTPLVIIGSESPQVTILFVRIRPSSRIAAAALAVGLFASACGEGATTVDSADSAANIYGTTEQLASGEGQFDFGSLEGQEAVLWFWAPW